MQTSLFETTEAELLQKHQPGNSLIISSAAKQLLTPQQQSFNRLIKKIEKLRRELEQTAIDLDQKLDYYAKHIHPMEFEIVESRKEVVKLVFPFYDNRELLTKSDRKILKKFFAIQLNEILSFDVDPGEDLKKIFKKVNGISLDEAADQDFELMKDELEQMFESEGFDLDLNDFKREMTPEEMMAKLNSMQEEFLKQEQVNTSKKQERKKTAKQIAKEAREAQLEEARNKDLSSIYRQLAKVLHPDLEQDETVKPEKEDLMKRLTTAYDSGDLYTMLNLEIEWMHKEEESFAKISKEKLAIYNQVLKEQAKNMEQQKFALEQHPRYHPLRRYSFSFLKNISVNLTAEKRKLEETLNSINESMATLKGKNALREIKMIIREFKNHLRNEDNFGFIEPDFEM